MEKKDASAMAAFYVTENDSAGRLAKANAERIVSAIDLQRAIKEHIDAKDDGRIVAAFKLLNDSDRPVPAKLHENGDVAVTLNTGSDSLNAVWFKKVDGLWRLDLTPSPPSTATQLAEDMEEDTTATRRLIDATNRAEFKSIDELRNALYAAMLNAVADEVLHVRLSPFPTTGGHDRPDPHGVFPGEPTTPGGAMNRLVQAIQAGDEATAKDSFELPNDPDGAARSAIAHDLVIGLRFMQTKDAHFPVPAGEEQHPSWPGVIIRETLRDYTDAEWIVDPQDRNLAESASLSILKTVQSRGQSAEVHEQGIAPLMRRGADGHWRIGLAYPLSGKQVKRRTAAIMQKSAIFERATKEIAAGTYASESDAAKAILPEIGLLNYRLDPLVYY